MASLKAYIISRVLLAIPMILILLSIVFLILRVMPGDPVLAMVGLKAPPEQIEELRALLGLDKPIHIQYVEYVSRLVVGDMGYSTRWRGTPVVELLLLKFPATLELAVSATVVSVLVGLFAGAYSAYKRNTALDFSLRLYSITIYAMFIPVLGMILQVVFGVGLGWLPTSGRIDPLLRPETPTGLYVLDSVLTLNAPALLSALKHLVLPSLTLGLVLSGIYSRLTRANMVDVLRQDFITSARARGIRERVVLYRHALKNAFIPILTVMGLQFALLLGGAVLTETTFSWPGIGRFLIESIDNRDFPSIQGTIVFFAFMVASVSLMIDILYSRLDPRIRY